MAYTPYTYRPQKPQVAHKKRRSWLKWLVVLLVITGMMFAAYKYFVPNSVEKAVNQLEFDSSVSEQEKKSIQDAVRNQSVVYNGKVMVSVKTVFNSNGNAHVLATYVPVTNVYSTNQAVSQAELRQIPIFVPSNLDEKTRGGIASLLNVDKAKLSTLNSISAVPSDSVAFIPATQLSSNVKLLRFNNTYYLDSLNKGAIFRQAVFSGNSAGSLSGLRLNNLAAKNSILKVNMTGVTALTRDMIKKLSSVKDATYFSSRIGQFLADADITHVSNEVSFKPNCTYNTSVFCAPPAMIDTLKDSGVDLVELTGNHNNDSGSQYNTDTINLYHKLGWHTVGGGLNKESAAEPYIESKKKSQIAFLGYNYADSPNGVAIATDSGPGANVFDFNKIKKDIDKSKSQGAFVIVDVQFWECYAYPDGFVEFPECDKPIGIQTNVFRKIADLGADMVIGTQAHQPQTYEIYKNKPIYYGLGNLYFEQDEWPGTERGIILTHYFVKGKLIQTKLSPTVYDEALQTHMMSDAQAKSFLQRLQLARGAI